MNAQLLPAGIEGSGIEVYKDYQNKLFYIQDGIKQSYLMMPFEYRSVFRTEMDEDMDAKLVMKKDFNITDENKMEEMFVSCRYGNLDYQPDLLDGRLQHDAPHCNNILSCPGFGVICKIPVTPSGKKLTRKEYHIISRISIGKQAKEIASEMNSSEATTRTHTQRIHAKLQVNNNVEVSKWAHKHRIVSFNL